MCEIILFLLDSSVSKTLKLYVLLTSGIFLLSMALVTLLQRFKIINLEAYTLAVISLSGIFVIVLLGGMCILMVNRSNRDDDLLA